MIKEFIKGNKVFAFDFDTFISPDIELEEQAIVNDGYMQVFDKRELGYFNGKGGSIVLEDNKDIQDYIARFQRNITCFTPKTNVAASLSNFSPEMVSSIRKQIEDGQVKNIIIENNFANINQFRHLFINLFSNLYELNIFIFSKNNFIRVINDELATNRLKYPYRNPPYHKFNDLSFSLLKNNFYECEVIDGEVDNFKLIKIADIDIRKAEYKKTIKFMPYDYKVDFSNIQAMEKKSKWNLL